MVRLLFAATLFLSATLLFAVQPMVAKMILPLLGGTPAVWITCMLFFQGALLGGYLYAHATPAWLGVRRQAVWHLVFLLLPVAALPLLRLPLDLARGQAPPVQMLSPLASTSHPTAWLLALLAVSAGLPFFAVATSAPLLQKWFTATGHPEAGDPYFLYGASNLGSMLALLGYPSVIEPTLRLPTQTLVWAAGYGLLFLLTGACAAMLWRSPPARALPASPSRAARKLPGSQRQVGGTDRLRWLALSFVPSALLLGVTTYLSTDIAAVPLLWVVPLALYLLTFILAFARRPVLSPRLATRVLPMLVLLQLFALLHHGEGILLAIALHLLTFFVAALVCHGELARRRPAAQNLTEFYLWMSVGGVLGGLFSAVVAPMLFSSVAEYPLELGLACLVAPAVRRDQPSRWGTLVNLGLPLVGGAFAAAVMTLLHVAAGPSPSVQAGFLSALAVIVPSAAYGVIAMFTDRPLLFGLGVSGLMLAGIASGADVIGELLYRDRTFFGVLQVTYQRKDDITSLYHGSTIHGREYCSPATRQAGRCNPARRDVPLTYYHPDGPIGQVFRITRGRPNMRRVAVVGLGAGSLASYGVPGQEMVFYEIDPAVERIACDLGYFNFVADSAARIRVVLGDGRLTLRRAEDGSYGLIILDAFSSDAVPVHLLTREALRDVYLPKLAPGGVIAFHVSNRYLNLRPVLGDLAQDAGLVSRVQVEEVPDETNVPSELKTHRTSTTWVIMARREGDLGPLTQDRRWKTVETRGGAALWTDDFSNILSVFK